MSIISKENNDICSYFITKHSWKGKYKRIFSIGTHGISTYNPSTLEVTNQWPYEEFINIQPVAKSNNEFSITMKKNVKKTDSMRFSTDHRTDLLTNTLKYKHLFADKIYTPKRYNACKYHWSGNNIPVLLIINAASTDQLDQISGRMLSVYDYKDIECIIPISNLPGGFALSDSRFSRLHIFSLNNREEYIKACQDAAIFFLGINIIVKKEELTLEQCTNMKFGKYSSDECLTSCSEFMVQKCTKRSEESIRRTFCLSETCIVERDPLSYHVVTCRPFIDIFAIVRDEDDPQKIHVEYIKGQIRTYVSSDRDAMIASIIDGVRASGNRDIHVKMNFTKRGQRLGPFTVAMDEEVESQHLKFISNPPNGMHITEVLSRFNSNIAYSGLLHAVTADTLFAENKERLINGALISLLDSDIDVKTCSLDELEAQMHALRRLFASKAGFASFTIIPQMREKVGLRVVKALKRNNIGVSHAAIDMLTALIQPMHDNYDLKQEQLNKSSILASKKFLEHLLDMMAGHIQHNSGALVVCAMLDLLTYSICAPYSETTDGDLFDSLLEQVANHGRDFFKLFQHPSLAIVKGAGLIMKALIEEGSMEIANLMQDFALTEGALARHLNIAFFTQSTDARLLAVRQLSRHLIGLWVTNHETSMALLKRILPMGLLNYLKLKDSVPDDFIDHLFIRDNLKLAQDHGNSNKNLQLKQMEEQIGKFLLHWKSQIGLVDPKAMQQAAQDKIVVLRKRRQQVKIEANWNLFYYQFNKDHNKSNLIWNHKTREELKHGLEDEIRSFNIDRDLSSNCLISWNHEEFEVHYNSLAEEIKIGDYYLRILLEEGENDENQIQNSYEFFNDLYHRFLLTQKNSMKCLCLEAMSIVYGKCYEEIGPFNDTKYLVAMLDRSTDRLERDRLILFLNKLLLHKKNVKEIIDSNGVKILVNILTLAHFHVSRATIPLQSNVIEAAPNMQREGEKEWYYGNVEKERLGPYNLDEIKNFWKDETMTSKTRVWAQGMEGWRLIHQVSQLKWLFVATGQAVMNESDLATLILNMFIKMCEYYPSKNADGSIVRPLPKVKQILTDSINLPHIVQLLVTFDPIIVEKVATLLLLIMEENPVLPRLYLTGVFYFLLMYTGSNVLPIAQFLKYTHLKQAFRSDENNNSDMMYRSILGHLLPEAMVCYLENYDAQKFAQIFLGEFDTPETIWNREMRRMMIEKIAGHIGDFSPRLQSNTRALYQYCPIPVIAYPQLKYELFCNIYYLRHLCNTRQFPKWPIQDPIKLLKDILIAWKNEINKKPPSMSLDDAYETLQLVPDDNFDESQIRKAYFKMAQKYHPDKNPEGRETFEKVNKAYEFLCSNLKNIDGPNPENLILIVEAQSILFSRFKDDLEPYKYAGYPMLLKSIVMESNDDSLFSKTAPLLPAATELCYHTVNCSALNAEELRREGGIEILYDALVRCISMVNKSSKPEDISVQVCSHIVRCFGVAAQFPACCLKILDTPSIVAEITRLLYYQNIPQLCQMTCECVSNMSVDSNLQLQFFKNGVLWHLLLFIFHYDYTLEEGGVEKSSETNKQEILNQLAIISMCTCARLGGCLIGNKKTPHNPDVMKSLHALLTPYITKKLSEDDPIKLLKLLNSNTENPLLLWNNTTRMELIEFLQDQQLKQIKSGQSNEKMGSDFKYSFHEKELIIGDIFVRLYIDQPSFQLENAKQFTVDLLDYLGSQAQYLHTLMSIQNEKIDQLEGGINRIKNVEMALEALHLVIKSNPNVQIQCIGHFRLLFSLLKVDGYPKVQENSLKVISAVTENQECVADIAASEVLSYLLLVIESLPELNLLALQIFYPLTSNTKILKEFVHKGGLIYLLDIFCNSKNSLTRIQTAELFGQMLSDKLVGPRIRILLSKFIPPVFMDGMRDSAEASVHMFEGTHENPELIWNEETRQKISSSIHVSMLTHNSLQRKDLNAGWNLTDETVALYSSLDNELVIGGVYIRLFINNPGWVVRKPKEFMVELLEKWSQLSVQNKNNNEWLEMITSSLCSFLSIQSALVDQLPQLGHLPKIVKNLSNDNDCVSKTALQIIMQASNSEICVRSFSQISIISQIKYAMKCRKDMLSTGIEVLGKLYQYPEDDLIIQALKCDLIPELVKLLESGLEYCVNPSAIKAIIVKLIKNMLANQKFTEKIEEILLKHPIWRDYKDQRHDLFIMDRPNNEYLTNISVAGYLTASQSALNNSNSPPPV